MRYKIRTSSEQLLATKYRLYAPESASQAYLLVVHTPTASWTAGKCTRSLAGLCRQIQRAARSCVGKGTLFWFFEFRADPKLASNQSESTCRRDGNIQTTSYVYLMI